MSSIAIRRTISMKKAFIAGITCISIILTSLGAVCAAGSVEAVAASAASEITLQGEYKEGEAIAIVKDKEKPQVSGEIEFLAEVGPEAVNAAIGEWSGSGYETGREFMLRNEEAQTYSIWYVSDHNKTAHQIIQELYTDPEVIAAEPNYVAYAEEQGEKPQEEKASEDVNKETTENNGKADLSPMQWYAAAEPKGTADSAVYTTPLSPEGGYNLEVPGWLEGHTGKGITSAAAAEATGAAANATEDTAKAAEDAAGTGAAAKAAAPEADTTAAPTNASGTICVMDTGVDTDHPDLQGVLYEFTPEQQARYGCGKYGYNASGDGRPVTEQKACSSHGTHVAGIIAANWNGEGVSGVASGVKIFSVNVFGGNGEEQDMKTVIKGFRFLVDAAQEVNLKAVNCSWGTAQPQFILSVMIDELGRKGVNTVIASGNRYMDIDESIDVGSQTRSVSAIVVNAASMDGKMTDFSCWGQDSTDVFAPGASILSPVPKTLRDEVMGTLFSYQDSTRFFPEATPDEHLLSGIERFTEKEPGVRFFDRNPAIDAKAKEIGEIDRKNGFDDKRSGAVHLSALQKEKRREGGFSAVNGYVYAAIPVPSDAEPKWISVKTAMSDGFKPSGGIDSITCRGGDGKPVEIDSLCEGALKKGIGTGAFYSIYQCQWTPLSYNVDGFIEASNELHEMLRKGMTEEERRNLGITAYRDPGKVTGVYKWEDQDRTYLIARIGIGEVVHDSRSLEVTKDTTLFIDNVAVGDEKAFTGAYEIMSGTSMAAPMVTGCLAVIAKDEPESASLSDEELEKAARERAAKLLAAVDYDDDLSGLCRTGGRVNLHGQTEFVRKAPLIERTEVKDQVLNLKGWYFGKSGTITVDGVEIEAQNWRDEEIEAAVRGLPNGSHVAVVTNADGAVSRAVFSTSYPDAEGRMLFERSHSLPISNLAFPEAESDRLYGPIAVCGEKLFTMSLSAKYKVVQGIWCYDIKQDTWSRIAMPEGLDPESIKGSAMAALRDRLYLYGNCKYVDEEGEEAVRNCLWRYEPYGDFWEALEIPVPMGSDGICALGEDLFLVGGTVYDLKLEGAPANEEGVYESGFYKVDLAKGALIRVGGDILENLTTVDLKLTAGKDKMYIFAPIDDHPEGPEEGSEQEEAPPANDENKTVSGGALLRVSYDASQNQVTAEDLTDALNEVLGDDLRTEYEYKAGGNPPGEHFAIAGLDDGVAIIGSSVFGEDVHIIYDTDDQPALYERATSYHRAFDPSAAFSDGTLYVIGYNPVEPDVMYFRSDTVKPQTTPDISVPGGTNIQKYIGWGTIGLFAVVIAVLSLTRRKKKEE